MFIVCVFCILGFYFNLIFFYFSLFYCTSCTIYIINKIIGAPRLALCSFNGASGFSPNDFIVVYLSRLGFYSFECFPPGFSSFFALIVKPDSVVFNDFSFAFWNTMVSYTVSQKTVQNCLCQNFVKFSPIVMIFGRKMAKRLRLCKVQSFPTSSNSC